MMIMMMMMTMAMVKAFSFSGECDLSSSKSRRLKLLLVEEGEEGAEDSQLPSLKDVDVVVVLRSGRTLLRRLKATFLHNHIFRG